MSFDKTINRIVIFGVDWLGDVLFSTPAVDAAAAKYSGAEITYITSPQAAPAIKGHPAVSSVWEYLERPFLLNIAENIALYKKLVTSKFDAALFLHRSKTRAWIAKQAGIPVRIGFDYSKRNHLMTHRVKDAGDITQHRAQRYISLIRRPGSLDELNMTYIPSKDFSFSASKIMEESGLGQDPFVVFHIGGNWVLKRYPVDKFARVGNELAAEGIRSVVCGTASESQLAEEFTDKVPESVSLCGKTNLDELAFVLKASKALVSNDSGPIHVAAALKIPLIGLFGPTDIESTGPFGSGPMRLIHHDIGCETPCYFKECKLHMCMESIKVDEVLNGLKDIFKESRSPA